MSNYKSIASYIELAKKNKASVDVDFFRGILFGWLNLLNHIRKRGSFDFETNQFSYTFPRDSMQKNYQYISEQISHLLAAMEEANITPNTLIYSFLTQGMNTAIRSLFSLLSLSIS